MNLEIFLLFFNCALTTLLAAAIVIRILRREYLPVIRRLEDASSREPSTRGE